MRAYLHNPFNSGRGVRSDKRSVALGSTSRCSISPARLRALLPSFSMHTPLACARLPSFYEYPKSDLSLLQTAAATPSASALPSASPKQYGDLAPHLFSTGFSISSPIAPAATHPCLTLTMPLVSSALFPIVFPPPPVPGSPGTP